MFEYARWNWPMLAIAYGDIFLFVLFGGAVRNAGLWIGAISVLTVGISLVMHDLVSRRHFGTVLALGIPSRIIARAMWYESVVLPALVFLCGSLIPAMFWGGVFPTIRYCSAFLRSYPIR